MRTRFLDVDFDRLTMEDLLDQLTEVSASSPFSYVVTPNVDHMVKIERDRTLGLRTIVSRARYCLCDSRILSRLAKLHGITLEVIPGSDLTVAVFSKLIADDDRIAVVGGDTVLAQGLAEHFPKLDILHYRPPMGLLENQGAIQEASDFVAGAGARFIFLAVGFPQQELIAARAAENPAARGMALCVGASLEFLTNQQKRAPGAIQRLGLEWAYRLSREPRRLWRRYLLDGPTIFRMAWRWRR